MTVFIDASIILLCVAGVAALFLSPLIVGSIVNHFRMRKIDPEYWKTPHPKHSRSRTVRRPEL